MSRRHPVRIGRCHDWRWNAITTLRVVDVPDSVRERLGTMGGPMFGDDEKGRRRRGEATRLIHEGLPGIDVHFTVAADTVAGGANARGELVRRFHCGLTRCDRMGPGHMSVIDYGDRLCFAYSHALGDDPTVASSLAPLLGSIWDADLGVDDLPMARQPMPLLLAAAVERFVRGPRQFIAAARRALAEEHAGGTAPAGMVAAEPHYLSIDATWPGDAGRRPRGMALAWDWRAGIVDKLGEDVIDPAQSWNIVGLRHGSRLLAGRGGNFVARIRVPFSADPARRDADLAEARDRIRSPLPIARTALSAAKQQVLQLTGRADRNTGLNGLPARQDAPVTGLGTSWVHNRLPGGVEQGVTVALIGPGIVSAVAIEHSGDRLALTVSAFVDDATWAGIEAATRATLTDAGYRL